MPALAFALKAKEEDEDAADGVDDSTSVMQTKKTSPKTNRCGVTTKEALAINYKVEDVSVPVKSSVALSYVSFRHTRVLCSTGRSTCPECSTPNPQPAPLRGHTFTCPTVPRKAAPSTAPWSRTADSGRLDTGSMCSWEVASPNC